MRYLDKLNDREYVDYLWDLEAFTLCFEKAYKTPEQETKGRHISYVKYKDVRDIEANKELARRWWDHIENDGVEHPECGKPKDIGRKLMVVYGRIEALASCVAAGICDRNRIYDFENKRGMIEAFDYLTILSISNYMLLASKVMKNGQSVSRGWSTFGQFETLVTDTDIERYVFDAQPVLTRVRGKSFGISGHGAILPRMRKMRSAIGTREMIGDHAVRFKRKGLPNTVAGTNSHSCGAAIFAPLQRS